MVSVRYFFDSHCHLFTMADIPLYRMIEQALKDSTNAGAYIKLPLLLFIDKQALLEKYKPFIVRFESEPAQNTARIKWEVENAVPQQRLADSEVGAEKIVLTPLVMDFDLGASVEKLIAQADRLKTAIASLQTDGRLKILPFLGVDPRRGATQIEELIRRYDVKSVKNRGGYDRVNSGEFIGIKLYPPLGFDVLPDGDPKQTDAFKEVYSLFAGLGLPITVHCQKKSLRLTDDADEFTNPAKWKTVLEALSSNGLTNLKINFAHFGGEEELKGTVDLASLADLPAGNVPSIDRRYWTYNIVQMLKKYPNAYSDISAFDFTDNEAVRALGWMLYMDENQGIDGIEGEYKLKDKLLWGSDYPMILSENQGTYSVLIKTFFDSIERNAINEDNPLTSQEFLENLFCNNPEKFLFS